MEQVVKFKIFCIERYKYTHGLTGQSTLALFKKHNVLEYIGAFYDVLHSYGHQYIVEDIEKFIRTRQEQASPKTT